MLELVEYGVDPTKCYIVEDPWQVSRSDYPLLIKTLPFRIIWFGHETNVKFLLRCLNDLIINISEPIVMAALFIGAMLPFLFSSMAMGAVGRAAMSMIEEVGRQFRDIPELKAALEIMNKGDESSWSAEDKATYEGGLDKAEHGKCVEISTQAAIKEMMLPGLLAVVSPIIIGLIGNQFGMGPEALGGLLAGVTVSGVAMAIFQ